MEQTHNIHCGNVGFAYAFVYFNFSLHLLQDFLGLINSISP